MGKKQRASRRRSQRSQSARRAYWLRACKEQKASGLTVAGFCSRRGLSKTSFHRWHRKLNATTADAMPGDAAPTFLPVRVVSPSPVPPMVNHAPGTHIGSGDGLGPIEVVLSGGRRLLIRSDFDGRVLAKIVSVLEAEEGAAC